VGRWGKSRPGENQRKKAGFFGPEKKKQKKKGHSGGGKKQSSTAKMKVVKKRIGGGERKNARKGRIIDGPLKSWIKRRKRTWGGGGKRIRLTKKRPTSVDF